MKSLAAEARIIRRERQRFEGYEAAILNEHRTGVVRSESRAAQLLYAFARGVPYRTVEPKTRDGDYYTALIDGERVRRQSTVLRQVANRAKAKGKKLGIDISDFDEWMQ